MLTIASINRAVDFLTSDQHFGHERMAGVFGREYEGRVEEMNAMMIERWNSMISPGDTVLHLGDFAMGTRAETLPIAGRLNGRILLMPGNHDSISLLQDPDYAERQRPLYEEAFELILPETGDRLRTSAGNEALLSHYPFSFVDPHASQEMLALMPVDDGRSLLVHGHTHEPEMVRGRQFHVGVDAHDFYPVRASLVEKWIDANSHPGFISDAYAGE